MLNSILFGLKVVFFFFFAIVSEVVFLQLFLKMPSGMSKRIDSGQIAPSGVCTVCLCHYYQNRLY